MKRAALVLLLVALSASGARAASESSLFQFKPPERCQGSQHAIGYYRRAFTASRSEMGLTGAVPRVWYDCKAARRRAGEWRDRAGQARQKLQEWTAYQLDWPKWLPAGWRGIARCETGLNWHHSNSSFQGAFGFAVSSWDNFVGSADPKAGPYPSEAYLATPRQQYEVALAIYRRYGLSGWGCRGAFYA